MKPFFIVSTARSGSTSLCKILDSATNASCVSEPAPTLGYQARALRENRRYDAAALVRDVVRPRLEAVSSTGLIYGEKNVTLTPFISELARQVDANFVHLVRDGRDVVSSLMNWHSHLFGSVYREANSRDVLSNTARAQAGRLLAIDDESDFARHRPHVSSDLAERWLDLSRFEMCSWYWAEANRELRSTAASLDPDQWAQLNYTGITSDAVIGLAASLGLQGLTYAGVDVMLDRRINSLADREVVAHDAFPHWLAWSSAQRDWFEEFAGNEMAELDFWNDSRPWSPDAFGSVWKGEPDLSWYTWMYEGRRAAHTDLQKLIDIRRPTSVCEVGCGLAVGYSDYLANQRYVGLDVSESNIAWCQASRGHDGHEYHVVDVGSKATNGETFDLVFSQGTIDNVYDMDAFLQGVADRSHDQIYVTAYSGWFPELDEHAYSYNADHGCFYNHISPGRARRTLEAAGAVDIHVEPLETGVASLPLETRITASMRGR